MPRFVLQFDEHQLLLTAGVWRIGRDSACEIRLTDGAVSRRHATLHVASDQVVLEDHGSRNGVHVNGQRVCGRASLDPGDRIRIGLRELQLLVDSGFDFDAVTRPWPTMADDDSQGLERLSAREREVFARLAKGETHREVADQLGLSIKTVETYRARIGEKLGIRTRADLIRYALDCGLLHPS